MLYALIAAAAYGTTGIIVKSIIESVSWSTLVVQRAAIGAVICWCVILIHRRHRRNFQTIGGRQIARLAILSGAVLVAGGASFFVLETVPVSLLIIVTYLFPALVAAVSMWIGAPFNRLLGVLSIALALTGVGLAIGGEVAPIQFGRFLVVIVVPLGLGGAALLQAYIAGERRGVTAARRLHIQAPAGPSSEVAPVVVAAVVLGLAALLGSLGMLLTGHADLIVRLDPATAWGSLALGVLAAVAIAANYAGAARLGAARSAMLATLEVFVVAVLETVLLGEHWSVSKAVGAVLIVISALCAIKADVKHSMLGEVPRG